MCAVHVHINVIYVYNMFRWVATPSDIRQKALESAACKWLVPWIQKQCRCHVDDVDDDEDALLTIIGSATELF